MTSPFENAISPGTKREYVARPCQIVRPRTRVDCREDCLGKIVRGNSGFDASVFRIDGDRKGSTAAGSISRSHQYQLKGIRSVLGNSQADQSARVSGHKIDDFWSDHLRRDHEIALVLAVFIVDDHDHAPSLELCECITD